MTVSYYRKRDQVRVSGVGGDPNLRRPAGGREHLAGPDQVGGGDAGRAICLRVGGQHSSAAPAASPAPETAARPMRPMLPAMAMETPVTAARIASYVRQFHSSPIGPGR
jgi:hypothetical protein